MSAFATTYRPRAHDEASELIQRHGDLVRRIAFHLVARLPASVDVDDLIQAGLLGLLDAAKHFSATMGASFETFASIRVRGSMIDEIRKGDWAPRSVHRRSRAVAEAIRKIEQSTGAEAEPAAVAAQLGMSLDEYHQATEDSSRTQVMSLHNDDGEDEAARVAGDPSDNPLSRLENEAFRGALARAIAQLPEREKQVMALYYQEEMNLKEIGATLGVTESRVCQIHGQALLRLKARLADWREQAEEA